MDSSLWTFVRSDTVTVEADGSTVVNVYYDRKTYTLTFRNGSTTVKTILNKKWGQDIHSEFPINDSTGATILWNVPNGCQSFEAGTYLASINRMPPENITFTRYGTGSAATIYYCVETLPGEEYTYSNTYNGTTRYFKVYKTVKYTKSGYLTYAEEFHDILGFVQWNSNPTFSSFDKDGKTNTINTNNYLYYKRNSFAIEYYNPTERVKAIENVPYQTALNSTTYNWTPMTPPAQYEPGSVRFVGWYLNPECTGQAFDFTTATMPAGPNNKDGEVALSLYAKWEPVTHTVTFYLDRDAYTAQTPLATHPQQTVAHGAMINTKPVPPQNGSYSFVEWFYLDENGNEKAFDFANMPITKDLHVYAKWSSNVLEEYIIYFKVQETGEAIAEPITGSALAGTTKTFDAKGAEEWLEGFVDGYFPLVKSHSLTINIKVPTTADGKEWYGVDGEIVQGFTFWYVQKDAMPYTVKYLDKETGAVLVTEKVVSDNKKAVVTENFVRIPGYMPDAYQKRLVVDASSGAVNEIIFYYTKDTQHAYYKISHHTQNLEGGGYTEYVSSEAVGDIGTCYTGASMTIPGFTYSHIKYFVNDVEVTSDITLEGVKLTDQGLDIRLYYNRNPYPYQVRYLEQGTGKVLLQPKNASALYGQVVTENAPGINNYDLVSDSPQNITITIDNGTTSTVNVITFYYKEKVATISYVVVGPEGCGTVNLVGDPAAYASSTVTENVKVVTGDARGAIVDPNDLTYKFVGWYSDAECKNEVSTNTTYDPAKPNDGWPPITTYYAKFDWNMGSLTITKTGLQAGESAIFKVNATPVGASAARDYYIVLSGPDGAATASATITNLQANSDYTVTEQSSWSWSYELTTDQSKTGKIIAGDIVTEAFVNKKVNKWLHDENGVINDFKNGMTDVDN